MNLWVKILYLKNQKLFNEIFDKSSNEYNDQKSLTFPKDLLHFLWNNCIKRNEFFSDEIIKQSVNSTKEKFEDHIISKFNETSRIYFDNLNNNFEEYLCDICFKDKGHIFNKLKINKTDIINYFKNLAYISNVEENKVKLKNAGVKLFDQYLIKFNPSGGKHE
jgi:hypothetical protein